MKTITIKDWPGPVGELQVHHNLPASPSNYNACLARNVGDIVMHYTGNERDTAKGNANYFHTGSRGASAHFFVDETSIWQPCSCLKIRIRWAGETNSSPASSVMGRGS